MGALGMVDQFRQRRADQTVDGRVLSKLGAYMTLDATMITYAPAPDSAFQLWGSSKPLLHVGSVEMTYFRESDKMRNNCSDAKNPIHFGLSFEVTRSLIESVCPAEAGKRFLQVNLLAIHHGDAKESGWVLGR